MKFDKLVVGMSLYDVHSYKIGNTKISSLGVWAVRVHEIDEEKRRALCSWNGNASQWYSERNIEKLKANKPLLVRTRFGAMRRPTLKERQELMAAKKSADAAQ